METLDKIPFSLDADQIMEQAHVEAGSADAAELSSLIDLAQKIGSPKAGYAASFVTGRNGDEIQIDLDAVLKWFFFRRSEMFLLCSSSPNSNGSCSLPFFGRLRSRWVERRG